MESLDEKLVAAGIEVPTDTPDAVKELLLQKHEEANALATQLSATQEAAEAQKAEAVAELQKMQSALKDATLKANANSGFGSFNYEGEAYVITMAKTQVRNKDREFEIITAEDLKKDKNLQARAIENKWGIVALKSSVDAAKKKGGK